jgi:hypothetical protein
MKSSIMAVCLTCVSAFSLAGGASAVAAQASQPSPPKQQQQDQPAPNPPDDNPKGKDTGLGGFGLSSGILVIWKAVGPDSVSSASVDANGNVRVDTRDNVVTGIGLELHHFFTPNAGCRPEARLAADLAEQQAISDRSARNITTPMTRLERRTVRNAASAKATCTHSFGWGPFLGVQAGADNNIISGVGAGLMFGWKMGADPDSHASLNFGIGYAALPAVKSLGSEFIENQKAPVDSSGKPLPVRYETHDAGGVMMMASFTF